MVVLESNGYSVLIGDTKLTVMDKNKHIIWKSLIYIGLPKDILKVCLTQHSVILIYQTKLIYISRVDVVIRQITYPDVRVSRDNRSYSVRDRLTGVWLTQIILSSNITEG